MYKKEKEMKCMQICDITAISHYTSQNHCCPNPEKFQIQNGPKLETKHVHPICISLRQEYR